MECSMCEVRSSVGMCSRCSRLLCEVCGKTCERCGNVVCMEHVHITRHGRPLCLDCYEERSARHEGAQPATAGGQRESVESHSLADIAPQSDEAEVGSEVLSVSARTTIPPWKLALTIAVVGLGVMLFLLVFPSFRRVTISSSAHLPTPFIFMLIPGVAIIWGSVGVTQATELRTQLYSICAVAIAALTVGLAIFEVYSDPARLAELEGRRNESVRSTMNAEQLRQWRSDKLRRNREAFKPTNNGGDVAR